MADDTFETDKLHLLIEVSPPEQFLGFSSQITGNRAFLNRALDRLPDGQKQLLVTVMEKGGIVAAAKEIAGEGNTDESNSTIGRINSALEKFREELKIESRPCTSPA